MYIEEDDHRIRARELSRKEIPASGNPWLRIIRHYILTTKDDYVICDNIAAHFQISRSHAGVCLGILVNEGILNRSSVDHKESHSYLGHKVVWNGSNWVEKRELHDVATMDRKRRIVAIKDIRLRHDGRWNYRYLTPSKKATEKFFKKHPYETFRWDGCAHFIIRGREFYQAIAELGLPDPIAKWKCSNCFKVQDGERYQCYHCGAKNPVHEIIKSAKLEVGYHLEKPSKTCEICGELIQHVTKKGSRLHAYHPRRVCNKAVVEKVMTE